jgi:CYTH domain-containing protein
MTEMKYAVIERERKFLVNSLPKNFEAENSFSRIEDRYIIGSRLRLRRIERADGTPIQFKLGQKYPVEDGKYEQVLMTNIYLTENEFALFLKLPATTLSKRRGKYAHLDRQFSVDVFENEHAGLILCEIELAVDDVSALELPKFVEREVTYDEDYLGATLAT